MRGWHEVGGYVGVFVVLGIAGLMRPRRALPWALLAAMMVALTMGARGPWWPWPLLHRLPVFSWEHLPCRFIIPLVPVIAVMAGFGADWIAAGCGTAIATALVVAATLDCFWVGTYNLRYPLQKQAAAVAPRDFRQIREPGTGYYVVSRDMLRLTSQNLGIINCYDYTQWPSLVAASGEPLLANHRRTRHRHLPGRAAGGINTCGAADAVAFVLVKGSERPGCRADQGAD